MFEKMAIALIFVVSVMNFSLTVSTTQQLVKHEVYSEDLVAEFERRSFAFEDRLLALEQKIEKEVMFSYIPKPELE